MLKIIKNKTNLLQNFSKIKKIIDEYQVRKTFSSSKFSFNIVSSNKEYSFNLVSLPSRTHEEYKKIKMEMGFTMLTEDDMKWIDENIYEEPNVLS